MMKMDYVMSWDEVAKEKQQDLYESFADRDWDCYKTSELQYLQRNIGHALYGAPTEEPDDSTNNGTGYSKDKLKNIEQICATIIKHDQHVDKIHKNDIRVAIVFAFMKIDIDIYSHIPVPIFRVPKLGMGKESDSNIFIDSHCRVYMGWANYLDNNMLPKCTYCYPRNGVYYGDQDDQVIVDFSVTPASKLSRKILNGVDNIGSAVSIGGTVVALAAFAVPVAAPIMLASIVSGAAVGVWGLGRSAENVVDRKRHHQNIGLTDAESRNNWIAIGANTLGIAAAGASKTAAILASRGSTIGRAGRIIVNAAQLSSIAANGIGIVNGLFVLHEKSNNGGITCLEIFQFSSSILFFTNSVVNLKLADTIIRETQQNVIQEFETSLRSGRHKSAYKRMVRNTRQGLDPMKDDAQLIKSITKIKNVDDFFAGVVRVEKHHTRSEAKLTFTETGHVEINNKIIVDPLKFASIDKPQRLIILDASKQLNEGTINRAQFDKTVQPIYREFGLESSYQGIESMSKICNAFGTSSLTDIDIGGNKVFSNLKPRDMARIISLVRNTFQPNVLAVAVELAGALGLHETQNVLKFLEFSRGFIMQILDEMEYAYQELLSTAKFNNNFEQSRFDTDYGINGDRQQHFLNLIGKTYSIGKKIVELRNAYDRYRNSQNLTGGTNLIENTPQNWSQFEQPIPSAPSNYVNNLNQSGASGQSEPECTHNNLSNVWSDMEYSVLQRNSASLYQADQNLSGFSHNMDVPEQNFAPENSNSVFSRIWNRLTASQAKSLNDFQNFTSHKRMRKSSVAEPVSKSSNISTPDKMCPETRGIERNELEIERDFNIAGLLTEEEYYEMAQMLTGVEANKYNSAIDYCDNLLTLVVIMDHNLPDRVVVISSVIEDKMVHASELL